MVFNAGIFLAGACGVAAGWGFFRALQALRRPVLGMLTGLCVALFGVSFVMAALFPLPDSRHLAYGMGMAVHLAPLFLLGGLWRDDNLRPLGWFAAASGVLGAMLLWSMYGVSVTEGDMGLMQGLYALVSYPWIGVAGYVLARSGRPEFRSWYSLPRSQRITR
jgi:hypothetical protein